RLDALLAEWSFPQWTGEELKQTVDGIFAMAESEDTLADLDFIGRLSRLELVQLETHVQALLNDRRDWFARIIDSPVPSRDTLSQQTRANWIGDDGLLRLEIGPAMSTSSRQNIEQFVTEVRAVVPNAGGRSVIEYGVGGVVVRAFQQATTLAGLGIVLILALYYRGLLVPAIILSSLAITTTLTFAVMELLGLSLNMANVLVVPLILGLGIDSAIHVTHRYMVLGDSDSFIHSSTPRAVFLSAVTTVATFASLMSSNHQGAASLGQLLAIAIPIMVMVTFTLIPSLLELVPAASRREAVNS
ncbi:MAG: MMPL family transporter, partial [Halieaceae bacterium]